MVERFPFSKQRIRQPRNDMKFSSKEVERHPILDLRTSHFSKLISDGNAVLRASIREFLISEHLSALNIPTTRALALTNLPNRFALRERVEPCAIVCRMAESWIRIGTFDLFRNRGDRETMRKLAEYCITHVFGEETLPKGREGEEAPNRFERLYREICLRNARTVAKWYTCEYVTNAGKHMHS
jgi:uncharacterized protein YdiU (UPF0061 family)